MQAPGEVQQGSGEGSEGSGEGLGGLWCRARSGSTGFRRGSGEVPEKVPGSQNKFKFNRVPEKVPEKVEGSTKPWCRRGFGAEPGQVQQGSGEGCFGAEPGPVQQGPGESGGVQQGSGEGSGGLGGFGGESGEVQQGSGEGSAEGSGRLWCIVSSGILHPIAVAKSW